MSGRDGTDDRLPGEAPSPDPDPTGTGPDSAALHRLGSNVRELRTAAGMTLDSLAAAVSGPGRRLEHSWIWKIEAGRQQPGLLGALRLAGALGAGLDELIEGIHWSPGEIAPTASGRRPSSERMAGFLGVLPPGEPAFEEPPEVSAVTTRAEVAAVIARNVRDARARRHLRQRDLGLADTAGAGLIESGGRQPATAGLLTIARALEVPPWFLLRGMRWEPPPGSARTPGPRGRRHDFHANDEAVARLWRADLTGTEIAAELGITRPSVEGIVRRLRGRGVHLAPRTRGRRAGVGRVEEETEPEARPRLREDPSDLRARVAANLRRCRLAAGLGPEQLAEAAEMSVGTVHRIEGEDPDPRLTTAIRLAASLGVPPTAIARGISWDPRDEVLALEPLVEPEGSLESGPVIGGNIRRRRRELGHSQEEVAARTGIQRRHLSSIESGEALPRPISLLALATGLETDPARLLEGVCDWYVRPLPPPEFAEGEGPPSKAERQERLLRMWGEGASTREIAEALDRTPSAVGGLINELRTVGIQVPYRHPPTSASRLSSRLRRRRGARPLAGRA